MSASVGSSPVPTVANAVETVSKCDLGDEEDSFVGKGARSAKSGA